MRENSLVKPKSLCLYKNLHILDIKKILLIVHIVFCHLIHNLHSSENFVGQFASSIKLPLKIEYSRKEKDVGMFITFLLDVMIILLGHCYIFCLNENKFRNSTWHTELDWWKFLLTVFGCRFLNFLFSLLYLPQWRRENPSLKRLLLSCVSYWEFTNLTRVSNTDVQSQVVLSRHSCTHRNISWGWNIGGFWSSPPLGGKSINTLWDRKNLKVNVSTFSSFSFKEADIIMAKIDKYKLRVVVVVGMEDEDDFGEEDSHR